MLQTTKKWVSMAFLLSTATLIATACVNSTDIPADATKSPSSTATVADQKPTKLKVFIASRTTDALYTNETLTWKELGKRLNIEFEFITGDKKTMAAKLPLMVASGDYPDIVSGSIQDFNKFGPQGAFIPLNDLIAKKAPNITKYLVNDKDAKSQTIGFDGNIYSVPMLSAVRTSEGPLIRQDWLQKLGLPVPETMDDWHTVLKAFKEKDPNGDGKNDEVAFSSVDTFYLNFADAWGIDLNTDSRWMQENGKMIYTPIDPRAKEFLATMNQWYNEGLFEKELLTRQEKDWQTMIFNNKVGATNHWIGFVAGFNDMPEAKKIPGFNFQVTKPPVLHKGDKALTDRQQQITVPWAWAISKNNKNVDATMKLFDYAYSTEGQTLLNFGVEGDTFTKQSDGTIKYTDKIIKNADGSAKALYRIGAQPLLGFRQDPLYEKASCVSDDSCKQLFNYVENKNFRDAIPTLKYSEADLDDYNRITTQINTYVDEMLSKFVVGQEPISKFDAFVAKVKSMNFDQLEKIQNKGYQKYKELAK